MGWQEMHNNRPLLAASVDVVSYIMALSHVFNDFYFQIICKNATLYTDMVLKNRSELELYTQDPSFQICEEVRNFSLDTLKFNNNIQNVRGRVSTKYFVMSTIFM